jgi:hypothetical protein
MYRKKFVCVIINVSVVQRHESSHRVTEVNDKCFNNFP